MLKLHRREFQYQKFDPNLRNIGRLFSQARTSLLKVTKLEMAIILVGQRCSLQVHQRTRRLLANLEIRKHIPHRVFELSQQC